MTWASRYPVQKLVEYDPTWPAAFSEIAGSLIGHLGKEWEAEHVGSTSVPGLVAKPVIDVALRVPAGIALEHSHAWFRRAGWTDPIVVGDHHCSFLLDGDMRRAIAHIFTSEQWRDAHVRLFSSWLAVHSDDRDAYGRLKLGLIAQGVWGGDYTTAKRAFVERIVNQARSARGQLPVTL